MTALVNTGTYFPLIFYLIICIQQEDNIYEWKDIQNMRFFSATGCALIVHRLLTL